jgi:hypothetical protein
MHPASIDAYRFPDGSAWNDGEAPPAVAEHTARQRR